jgi:Tfp pilus assembly protein PilO
MTSANPIRNRFMIAAVLLLVLDAAALAFLFTPWGRPPEQREAEYNRLRSEWQQKRREAQPLIGMPQKLERANKDAEIILKGRVADQSSQVSNEIGKLAAADNVRLEHAEYETKDTSLPGIERIVVKASLSADYLQLVKFINAIERSKMLMVLDSVKLNEQQGGGVKVDLVMESYSRAGS